MKLRGKMVTLALAPIAAFAIALLLIIPAFFQTKFKEEMLNSLTAMAYEERDTVKLSDGENYYHLVGDHLLNGDSYDITDDTEMMDNVKQATGVVLTVFYGDTRYATSVTDESGKRVLGTKASDTVIDEVLNKGNVYVAEKVPVVGKPYYAAYVPIFNDAEPNKPVGMVFAGLPEESGIAIVNSIRMTMILIAVLAFIAVAVIVVIVASRMVHRIRRGVNVLNEVAQGNLTVRFDDHYVHSSDETGEIVRASLKLEESLSEVLKNIVKKSEELDSYTASLSKGAAETSEAVSSVEKAVTDIAEGATSQANDTQKATESVLVMGNMVEQTESRVDELTAVSDEMEKSGKSATDTLIELESINKKAKDSIDVIYRQTNTTNESAKKIAEAINLITAIAEETNLLSLNASIEAARAGEQGRGFAVVATQIQKLAEQSNESAGQIELIANSLMKDSEEAVATMNEVNEIMAKQSEMVEKTGQIFDNVINNIKTSREGISNISKNTKEVNKSREEVVDIVQSLSAIAEENAASTEETSAATTLASNNVREINENAKNLKSIAEQLVESVSVFKIN